MNRLGLRLATAGGRGALVGLALAAVAVAIGAAILLFALAFRPALDERAERAAWRTSYLLSPSMTAADAALLMATQVDSYQGQPLVTILVARLVDDARRPPGVDRLPGPGEAVVSPALAARIAAVPADELGDRIGTVVGTIGDAGLRSPDELVAIRGMAPNALEALGASPVTGFDGAPKAPDIPPIAMLLIALAIIGALVPVAVFVSTATRLSAARREQRMAALRLIGATNQQIRRLALVEAAVVTVTGVIVGLGLFVLLRPIVATIPLDEATWFPDTIVPPLVPAILLLMTIPVVGALAAIAALRRVEISPLGVQRRQTPPMPSVLRAVPLVVSLLALVASTLLLRDGNSTNVVNIGLVGLTFGGVIVGMVLIGPWLTMLVGRVLHRVPGGASMLLASRRLTDDPRGSFGAIAGVIMAVFVASAFFTFVGYARSQEYDRAGVVHDGQVYVEMPYNEGPSFADVPARIAAVPGVRSVVPVVTGEVFVDGSPMTAWIAPCPDLARQFDLGALSCGTTKILAVDGPPDLGTGDVSLIPDRGDRSPIPLTLAPGEVGIFARDPGAEVTDVVARIARVNLPQVLIDPSALPAGAAPSPTRFYVDTDGSAAAGERVRSVVMAEVPTSYVRLAAENRSGSRVYEEFGRVVALGLLGTLDPGRLQPGGRGDHERPRAPAAVRPAAQRGDAGLPAPCPRRAPGRRTARRGRAVQRGAGDRRRPDRPSSRRRDERAGPGRLRGADPRGQPGRRHGGRGDDAAAARTADPTREHPDRVTTRLRPVRAIDGTSRQPDDDGMPEPSGGAIEGQPWDEARGPHLPDRLTRLPLPTILFGLLAIGMAALVVRGILSQSSTLDPYIVVQTLVGAIPTVVAFLLPAALFLRHRDAWQTHFVLVVGTVLFGVVEILQYISPGLSDWFASVIPPPEDLPLVAPLGVGYSVVVGFLSAMAPFLVARGLLAARNYEDAPRSRRWWLIVAVLTLITGVTSVLTLVNISLDIPPDAVMTYYWLTVLNVVLTLVGLFAWAYLAGTALIGWRASEDPGRGWGLAALGGCFVLLGLAMSGIITAINIFAEATLPNELALGHLHGVRARLPGPARRVPVRSPSRPAGLSRPGPAGSGGLEAPPGRGAHAYSRSTGTSVARLRRKLMPSSTDSAGAYGPGMRKHGRPASATPVS